MGLERSFIVHNMSINKDILDKLKNAGALSEQLPDLGFVPTGSYALNWVVAGDMKKGIPIGAITQIRGPSSTAKTVVLVSILVQAQKMGYHTCIQDSENALSPSFAEVLGLDIENIIYAAPETIEDAFDNMEKTINAIRTVDPDTPIVIGYDSIAVSPAREEFKSENFEQSNMIGALRAKITGSCLRRINVTLRRKKVALIIVNQLRDKVGILYGNPETLAAGGKSLEYYIAVDLRTSSNKSTDLIRDDNKEVIGITGNIENKKNKVSLPYRKCEFRLFFNKGVDPYFGVVPILEAEGLIKCPSSGWYEIDGLKFRKSQFEEHLFDAKVSQFDSVRKILGISVDALKT